MALTKVEAEQLQAAQTSITSVGTLTSLDLSGNLTANADIAIGEGYKLRSQASSGGSHLMLRSDNLGVTSNSMSLISLNDIIIGAKSNNAGTGNIYFGVGSENRTSGWTDTLTILEGGNVGVGVTAPKSNLHVLGTLKVATGNAQGILGLGEGAGTTVNVGLWRGAANNPTSDGNFLNLGGYDGILFAASNAAIGSQSERMRLTSAGILQIAGGGNDSVGEINLGNTAQNANRLQIRHQSSAWYLKTVDSDPLILGTSNQERLKLEANGNSIFQGNNHTNLQVKAGDNSTTAFLQTVQGSDARFGTSSNHQLNIATNGQFRLSIKNTGQVGIGVTDPTQKLDVRGGSGAGTLTHAIFTGTSSRGLEIRTRSDTSAGQNSGTAEINSADSEGTGGDLAFSSNGNVRMFIDGGGNVGIGTTDPDEKLHIEGSLLIDAFNAGSETGIFFREGFSSSNKYNQSILAYDHNGANPDGISINAYDGISFCTGSNARAERMRVTQSGNLIVGSTTTSHTDETKVILFPSGGQINAYSMAQTNEWWVMNNIVNQSGYTTKIDFRVQNSSKGYIGIQQSTVSFYGNSDYRLKENYNYNFDATSLVKAMKPLEFTWKEDPAIGKQMGFLAHELKEVTPYVVQGEKDEMRDDGEIRPQVVDQGKLVAVLTKAIQEQQELIETLQTKVAALEAK